MNPALRFAVRAVAVFVLVWAVPSFAEIFEWTDDQGSTHFSDNIGSIPEKHRKTAKRLSADGPAKKGDTSQAPLTIPSSRENKAPATSKAPTLYPPADGAGALSKKSPTEELRERVTKDFEASIRLLSQKAGSLRTMREEYDRDCAGSSRRTAYGVDSRGRTFAGDAWFSHADTPMCKNLLRQIEKVDGEIRTGLETSDEMARKADVYPGVRRDIRGKYGLEPR